MYNIDGGGGGDIDGGGFNNPVFIVLLLMFIKLDSLVERICIGKFVESHCKDFIM